MKENDIIIVNSVDTKIELIYKSDIRFGPRYYILSVNNKLLMDRVFGSDNIIDNENNIIALQEWLSIDNLYTALFIIDIENTRAARLSKATNGYIIPIKFEKGKIIYKKEYTAGQIIEYEMELNEIKNWEQLLFISLNHKF